MFLFLSAQEINFLEIGLLSEEALFFALVKIETRPEDFLKQIFLFLKQTKCPITALRGIVVINGPGSFTSLRLLITIVNSFIFTKDIPAVGLENSQREDSALFIKKNWSVWSKALTKKFIKPFYDRPPLITIKK